jgi:hypothetical protein
VRFVALQQTPSRNAVKHGRIDLALRDNRSLRPLFSGLNLPLGATPSPGSMRRFIVYFQNLTALTKGLICW